MSDTAKSKELLTRYSIARIPFIAINTIEISQVKYSLNDLNIISKKLTPRKKFKTELVVILKEKKFRISLLHYQIVIQAFDKTFMKIMIPINKFR